MKKYLSLLIIFLSVFAGAKAQDLMVRSFTSEPTDLTARIYEMKDNNKESCAVVKVLLAKYGAKFDGNIIGEPTFEASQYLLYMTKGSKRLDVMLEGFLPLTINFSDYGIESLNSLETYKLVLAMPVVTPVSKPKLFVTSITKDATIFINGEKIGIGSWEGELPTGDYTITARKLGYIAQSQIVHFTNEMSVAVSIPELIAEPRPSDNAIAAGNNVSVKQNPAIADKAPLPSFYVGVNYQVGSLQGLNLNLGTYINQINVEFDFVKGFSESETLYHSSHKEDTFSAMAFGLRGGYGIPVAGGFRVTPQLGLNYVQVSGKDTDTYSYSTNVSLGVKADYNFTNNFGISLCPEFAIPMSQGEVFKELSDVDSTIKGFGSGFNLRIGAYLSF